WWASSARSPTHTTGVGGQRLPANWTMYRDSVAFPFACPAAAAKSTTPTATSSATGHKPRCIVSPPQFVVTQQRKPIALIAVPLARPAPAGGLSRTAAIGVAAPAGSAEVRQFDRPVG